MPPAPLLPRREEVEAAAAPLQAVAAAAPLQAAVAAAAAVLTPAAAAAGAAGPIRAEAAAAATIRAEAEAGFMPAAEASMSAGAVEARANERVPAARPVRLDPQPAGRSSAALRWRWRRTSPTPSPPVFPLITTTTTSVARSQPLGAMRPDHLSLALRSTSTISIVMSTAAPPTRPPRQNQAVFEPKVALVTFATCER